MLPSRIASQAHPSDPFLGGILTLACGDALGAPTEFKSAEEIARKWRRVEEMIGGGKWLPGEWTDDTGMTLCVAQGILAHPQDPVESIGRRFLTWQKTAKDVGSTIAAALARYAHSWSNASRNTHQAKIGKAAGNGSLMRTLPVALAYPDRHQMLTESARISAMTHWDPQAELACAIYCLWVRHLLRGKTLRQGWDLALSEGKSVMAEGERSPESVGPSPVPTEFWDRLRAAPDLDRADLQPSGYAGYSVECLETAVWFALNGELTSDPTDETLIEIANMGGETDTIGAVTGGLLGTARGPSGLRPSWLEAVHRREDLEKTARNLLELRHQLTYATPNLPGFEYWRVSNQIVAGRNPLTHKDVEALIDDGVTTILDLRQPQEWEREDKYGAEAVAAIASSPLERHNIPIKDASAPASDQLDQAWQILGQLPDNQTAYIHCRAGQERTAAILCAVVGRQRGAPYDRVLASIQDRGPFQPLEGQVRAVESWLGG